jgi:hypothetical protein
VIDLVLTDALRRAAARCVWFEPPEQAIRQPSRLAAYILTYGDYEDTQALRDQLDVAGLRALLDAAPPGIFDGRSWAYWNLMVDRFTPPPLPVRTLGATEAPLF